MTETLPAEGITFTVDRVRPAAKPLREKPMFEAVKRNIGSPVESCSDYHARVVEDIHYHPLLAAVYTAFNEHRPLVLTPDAVWITIVQGVAHHMTLHGERLRERFVSHQGRLKLTFEVEDWIPGLPENPWAEAFSSWAGQIRDHVGPELHDTLSCDFSTTGPVERAVGDIVMMDVFERYFRYEMRGICGIPTVTLEGTAEDWEWLEEKAAGLAAFDMDWWLPHLLPICREFAKASRGEIDRKHWGGICKLREAYGGHIINGWVVKLFPYILAFIEGPCSKRNPIFETGEGIQTFLAPSGLSKVPFQWRWRNSAEVRLMEAIGGLVGVTQHPESLALRPKVGWAIRETDKFESLLARLDRDHGTHPGYRGETLGNLRPDMDRFHHHSDGADFFGKGAEAACRLLPAAECGPIHFGEEAEGIAIRSRVGRAWHRFATLRVGDSLAINLDWNLHLIAMDNPNIRDQQDRIGSNFAPICLFRNATIGKPGVNPVIALSFTEFLERILGCESGLYWEQPDFTPHGDAEEYTRWESLDTFMAKPKRKR